MTVTDSELYPERLISVDKLLYWPLKKVSNSQNSENSVYSNMSEVVTHVFHSILVFPLTILYSSRFTVRTGSNSVLNNVPGREPWTKPKCWGVNQNQIGLEPRAVHRTRIRLRPYNLRPSTVWGKRVAGTVTGDARIRRVSVPYTVYGACSCMTNQVSQHENS
jgi:hypothetical protein